MIFKQLRALRWPDLFTLLGLLCVSSSVYCSFKHLFTAAYVLLLAQLALDYVDGKLARTIGGGALGVYLDSFSDFMSVCASVVFGWFIGIENLPMYIAGFLNIGAAAVRLSYFTVRKKRGSKDYTGVPTVLASVLVTSLAFLGYVFFEAYIQWFAILYFASAVAMISDLKVKKVVT
jgi:phosphatidylserine synthase